MDKDNPYPMKMPQQRNGKGTFWFVMAFVLCVLFWLFIGAMAAVHLGR